MNVLVIAPHPDDEAIGCAGAILQHVEQGDHVEVLYLTSGEKGCPGRDEAETAATREAEADDAAHILEVAATDFWREPDGALKVTEDLVNRLVLLLLQAQTDLVYVTHARESHTDHRAAAELVRRALLRLPSVRCLTYEVWTPLTRYDRVLDTASYQSTKDTAIRAHASQQRRIDFAGAAEGLATYRGRLAGVRYAEVFERLGSMKNLTIVLYTYAPSVDHVRHDNARETLEAILKCGAVDPARTRLALHIADDGSPPEHVEALQKIIDRYNVPSTLSVSNRRGYGANYNLACQTVHDQSDYILALEDDWALQRRLDMEPLMDAMDDSNGELRCIRFGYLGFTHSLRGEVKRYGQQTFLLLDPGSEEHHIFAGHARLETVSFQRDLGAWPEGLAPGQTEWEVCKRPESRVGVAWPLDIGNWADPNWGALFPHIGGESFNGLMPEPSEVSA